MTAQQILAFFLTIINCLYAEQLPPPIFHRLLKNSLKDGVLQEEKCTADNCYQVFDILDYWDYEPHIIRILGFSYPDNNAHSFYELEFPTEAPFWSGVIPRDSTENHNILLIGVAGASFNNYWAATYPQLNITAIELNPLLVELGNRWFPIDHNNRHRVVTEDGAIFFTKAVERGEHYHAIILDATYDDCDREVVAPVDVFRSLDIVEAIDKILIKTGVLIVNVVIGKKSNARLVTLGKVVEDFKKVFKFVEVYHSEDFNNVMLCHQVPIDSSQLKDLPEPVANHIF